MPVIPPSTKEQIVRAAEQLFAARGFDGVSVREIAAAAGNGNNSAVKYHFGSKEQLAQTIFESRLPQLDERRRMLIDQHRPRDLRTWVECYILPILEQGEREGSHYLGFIAMLQQSPHREVFGRIPDEYRASTRRFLEQVGGLLGDIPEPLRTRPPRRPRRLPRSTGLARRPHRPRQRRPAGPRLAPPPVDRTSRFVPDDTGPAP